MEKFLFLGHLINIATIDRNNFHLMYHLAIIEKEEQEHKNGLSWFTTVRDRYGIRFNVELEQQILDILTKI